jgi:ERCC4 domain
MNIDGGTSLDIGRQFIVARNPNRSSGLPFLVQLPLENGPLWLRAQHPWPRAARVFCEQLDEVPTFCEVVERVEVILCRRSGRAIDVVLKRGANRRCQFIFVTSGKRRMVFWQTAKTVQAARPGLRIPTARLGDAPVIYIDTRERYGYQFTAHSARVERRALPAGDYGVVANGRFLGVVERKSLEDFVTSLVDGSLMFTMAEISSLPFAAIAVEGSYSKVLRHDFSRNAFAADLVLRLQVRYPQVPIVFLETKKLAEDWTFRFLRAAYENGGALPLGIGAL